MKQLMKKLWNDEGGFILSTEAMILWTICVLGLIVGLAAVRDAAVVELTEVANTLLTFDQTYAYGSLTLFTSSPTFNDAATVNGSAAQDVIGTGTNPASLTWYSVNSTIKTTSAPAAAGAIAVGAP